MKRTALNERQANRLARILRDRRAALGWSINQLADASGANPATIFKLERGQLRTPQVYTIRALGQALGLDTYLLFVTAEWLSPGQLPPLGAYLRSGYNSLSEADIAELQQQLEAMTAATIDGPGSPKNDDQSA